MMNVNAEMIEKAKAASSVEELLALAKENGIDMTADEAATCFEQINANALDDDLLDGVSGGWMIFSGDESDPYYQEPRRGGKRKGQCQQ